jgi:hypothetical protein
MPTRPLRNAALAVLLALVLALPALTEAALDIIGNFAQGTFPKELMYLPGTRAYRGAWQETIAAEHWEVVSSGYTAVWAEENTRASIWDAMQRRETYATTGSRMIVRFFGGWDFEASDANNRLPAKVGYTKGVPMGGDLSAAPQGKSPTFLVAALKDPLSGNLDRAQVIKGWLGKDGKLQERIYDVAVSDGRKIDTDGRCRTAVGNTVDVPNATWSNTIGAPVWYTPGQP